MFDISVKMIGHNKANVHRSQNSYDRRWRTSETRNEKVRREKMFNC